MTKHPHIPELKEPEVPKQSEIYVFDRGAIAAYYKSMPLADGRNRIGQYRAVLPKLEPPVPVGSFYMYDDAEGNWLVCQLVGKVAMARRRDRPLWAGQEGSRPRTPQKAGCLRARRKEQDRHGQENRP